VAKIIKIEDLFSGSADRFLTDTQLQPDPSLVAEGWERRFTADANRASEAAEIYARLGYEVRLAPLMSERFADERESCHSSMVLELKAVYTRRKKE